MTEEERKYIKDFEDEIFENRKIDGECTYFLDDKEILYILKLIKKQQKELNQLTEENEMLKGMFKKSMKE